MFQRLKRGGWPYSQPPNVDFDVNWESEQSQGLKLWMPWGGGTPGAHRHVDRIRGLTFTEGGTPVWVSDGQRGWSMLFDDGVPEYLTTGSAVVTAAPLTMSAWVYLDDLSIWHTFLCISDVSVATDSFRLVIAGFNDTIRFYASRASNPICQTSTSIPGVNAWHHVCGVAYAVDSRAVFLDGGGKGTSAVGVVPVGLDTTTIGYRLTSVPTEPMSGRIADVRIYNIAKTDAQVQQMYANSWELWRPRIRRVWAMAPGVARIPRPPAAYNVLMIY